MRTFSKNGKRIGRPPMNTRVERTVKRKRRTKAEMEAARATQGNAVANHYREHEEAVMNTRNMPMQAPGNMTTPPPTYGMGMHNSETLMIILNQLIEIKVVQSRLESGIHALTQAISKNNTTDPWEPTPTEQPEAVNPVKDPQDEVNFMRQ